MKIPTPFAGGCLCGAIRYECKLEPLMMFNCHCRTCQMSSGAPYVPVVLVSSKAFHLTKGELKYSFSDNIQGGVHKRGFCGDCGARITGGETTEPGRWLGLTASSLDDSSWYAPSCDIFVSHAQPWDELTSARPHHPEYPPR